MKYGTLRNNPKTGILLPNFKGGINLSQAPIDLEDNQMVYADNLRLDNGVIKTREALKVLPDNEIGLSNGEIIQTDNAVLFQLSHSKDTVTSEDTTALGFNLNNDYKYRLILFADKIMAVCVYSETAYETGTSQGHFIEFSLDTANTDAAIQTAITGLSFIKFHLINDTTYPEIITAGHGIVSCNTITGYIAIGTLKYKITLKLVSSAGVLTPKYTLTDIGNDSAAYIPTVIINAIAGDSPGGDSYEDFSLYTPAFKEEFMLRETYNQLVASSGRAIDLDLKLFDDSLDEDENEDCIVDIYGSFKFAGDFYNDKKAHSRAWREIKGYPNDDTYGYRDNAYSLLIQNDGNTFFVQGAMVYYNFFVNGVPGVQEPNDPQPWEIKSVSTKTISGVVYRVLTFDSSLNIVTNGIAASGQNRAVSTIISNDACLTSYHARATIPHKTESPLTEVMFSFLDDDGVALTEWSQANKTGIPAQNQALKMTFSPATGIVNILDNSKSNTDNTTSAELKHCDYFDEIYLEKVIVTARKTNATVTGGINILQDVSTATIHTWFGGAKSGLEGGTRLFIAGFDGTPNRIRYSDLNNPTYFPENNFFDVGDTGERITALAKQDTFLAVFKEHSIYAIEYAYNTSDTGEITVYFPSTPISPGTGCDCPNSIQLINDKLTWLTSEGIVYTLVSANQWSERTVREISGHIKPMLRSSYSVDNAVVNANAYGNYLKNAMTADYDGQYLIFCSNSVFVWDYDAQSLYNYSSTEKAQDRLVWLKWTMPFIPKAIYAQNNKLMALCEESADTDYMQRLFEFAEGEHDETIDYVDSAVTVVDVDITSTLLSKQINFKLPKYFKRIGRIYLDIDSDYLLNVLLKYITDTNSDNAENTVTNDMDLVKGNTAFNLNPHLEKVRTVQFMLTADAPLSINSLQADATILGGVK